MIKIEDKNFCLNYFDDVHSFNEHEMLNLLFTDNRGFTGYFPVIMKFNNIDIHMQVWVKHVSAIHAELFNENEELIASYFNK